MGLLRFVISDFQVIVLTLLIIIVTLMLLWSCLPVIMILIYRKLRSIEKILKSIKKEHEK